MATTQNSTQFMTSVMEKLRLANQMSNSNNLEDLASKGKGSFGISSNSSIQEEDIINQAKTQKKKGNAYKEDFVNGFGINDGQGLITDEKTREVISGILTPIGTVTDVANEIGYGVLKVGEGIVDAFVGLFGWIGTLFGGDDQWAKDFISVDASRYAIEGIDFAMGGWATQLALGETLAEQSAINYIPSEEVQANIRGIGNVVGEIIPSLVLAYFTGGSSLALQIGGQAALSGVSTMGMSTEGAVNENPDVGIGEAVGYGAIKGGISAVLAGVSMGTGSALAAKGSQGIAGKIGDAIVDKGGNMIAVFAGQAGYKATTAAGRAALMTAVDPLLRQITIDGNAIQNAYGNDENVKRTLESIGKNAATAAIVSIGMSAVQDTVAVKKAGGLDNYKQNYIDEMVIRKSGLTKEMNQVKNYISEVEKLDKDLSDNLITKDEWIQKIDELNQKVSPAMSKINELTQSENIKDYQNTKYSAEVNVSKQKAIDMISKVEDRTKIPQFIKVARESGATDTEIFNKLTSEGIINGKFDIDGQGETVFTSKDGYNLKLPYNVKDGNVIPNTSKETYSLIGAVAQMKQEKPIFESIQLPKSINAFKESDTPLSISTKAIQDVAIANPTLTPSQLTNIVKDVNNVSLISEDLSQDQITLVSKKYGENGKPIFRTYLLDTNTHTIKAMSIADKIPEKVVSIKTDTYESISEIKAKTNLKEGKLTSFKTTVDIVKHTKNIVTEELTKLGYDATSLKIGHKDLPRELLRDINLTQNKDSVSRLVKSIFSATLNVNGNKVQLKDLLPNTVLSSYKKNLAGDLIKIIEARETPTTMSRVVDSFNKKIANLIKKIEVKDKMLELSTTQIKELKTKSIAYRNQTIEVNKAIANMDLTRKQFNVDKGLYKSEIENNGTIKSILKSLPRVNMVIRKEGNIRISDTQGLYLSEKYSQWAKNSISSIKDLIDKGAFVNLDGNDLLNQFETLAFDGDIGSKHLNIAQMQALTNIMKMLRFQVSDVANKARIERRNIASSLHKEQSSVNKFFGSKDKNSFTRFLSRSVLDNTKLMNMGDMATGYDNSELQKIIDKMIIDDRENYGRTAKEWNERYIDNKKMIELSKSLKGNIRFGRHKLPKTELLSMYEQLSDSETYELFCKKGNYFETIDGNKITYYDGILDDIKDTLGHNIISLDEEAIIRGIYNDHSEGSYIPRVQQTQIENSGFTTIPDRNDYVPRVQGTFRQRNDTLSSMDMNEAKAKATSNSNLKERTQTGGKLVLKTYNPISQASKYLDKMNKTINTTKGINDFLSYFELNIEEDGVTYRAKEDYGDFMPYLKDLAKTLDNQSLSKEGLISKAQGLAAGATLGLKVIGPVKNFIALCKELNALGYKATTKGLFSHNKKLHQAIKESGAWYLRYKNGIIDVVSNTSVKGTYSKFVNRLSFLYEVFDKFASLKAGDMIYEYVKAQNLNWNEEELINESVRQWNKNINQFSSTAEKFAKSTAALGKMQGKEFELGKSLFAFQSDTIAGASMVNKDLVMAAKSKILNDNAKKVMDDPNATAEEKKEAEDIYKKTKSTQTRLKKAIPAGIVALLGGAVLKYLIDDFEQRVKGKKTLTDQIFDQDSLLTILNNTAESFIPFYSTISSAIKYNEGKTEIFAFSAINDLLTSISELSKGQTQKGLFDLTFSISKYMGIPLKNLYNDVVAITKWFDPETAIKMNNLLYATSDTTNVKMFSESVKKGDDRTAMAYLDMVLNNKVGNVSKTAQEEFYNLYKTGSMTLPKTSMESYTNEKGEVVTLNDLQKKTFKNTYSKANNIIDDLLRSYSYKALNVSEKSKSITYIYNAYYEYAKSLTISGYIPSTKFGMVVTQTKGNIDSSTTATALSHIQNIEDTKTKTRKELVIKYVNSLKCEKALKYLILKLAGFGLDEKAKNTLKGYLVRKGMTGKEAKEFLK